MTQRSSHDVRNYDDIILLKWREKKNENDVTDNGVINGVINGVLKCWNYADVDSMRKTQM